MDEVNRIESSEIIPHTYDQMIFDKGAKTIQWGKDCLFINGTGEIEYPHAKE